MEDPSSRIIISRTELENPEIKAMNEDRINFKLSLRKKKYNDLLAKKRIFSEKPNSSSRPYELFLSKLKLPSNYKIIFSKEDEQIQTALDCMKSDDIITVTYGVCLMKTYITNFLDDEHILKNLNMNFISDILNLLDKYCEKKETRIVYNLLHILTNYSYINENNKITKILLSSKGYRVWDLCFDMQDYEIMGQMVWILNNIIYKDGEGSYNLIKSNFFKNKIYSFYNNEIIMQHMNEKDPNNIFYIIIQCGINLFANLISVTYPSSYDQKDKYQLSAPVFDLILKYAQSNSEEIYATCIYAISLAIDDEPDLADKLDNNNIFVDILNKKYFSNEQLVLYANRIIGNYTANKAGLSEEFYIKCIQYEFDIFFGIKLPLAIKETYWILSNILSDYAKGGLIICNNEPFINLTMYKYQNLQEVGAICEIVYFLDSLVNKCGVENFIKLIEKGIIDITMRHAKMNFTNYNELITILKLIDSFLFMGDSIRGNYMGKNIVLEKCEKYGLQELLEKYINTKNIQLSGIIEKINTTYYYN